MPAASIVFLTPLAALVALAMLLPVASFAGSARTASWKSPTLACAWSGSVGAVSSNGSVLGPTSVNTSTPRSVSAWEARAPSLDRATDASACSARPRATATCGALSRRTGSLTFSR